MLNKDCHHDCNQNSCPFAQDANNTNRYVCLKCGIERNIDRNKFGIGSFWLMILALLILFLLLGRENQQNELQQQQEPVLTSSLKMGSRE